MDKSDRHAKVENGDLDGPSLQALVRGPSAEQVARAVRLGMCPTERAFDQFLPYELRLLSSQYWTPLVVALRVGEWLDRYSIRSVVDIGSGVGKFCIAAALASRCTFAGIEHRKRLVAVARGLACAFDVHERVSFIEGALGDAPMPEADAYYLFNPFGENLFPPDERLGSDVELNERRLERDVAVVEGIFRRAPVGTYVIKYNGFGGRMPRSYKEIIVDREMPCVLRMWRKVGPSTGGDSAR
ncbi:MAG TPA: hypothetical protein VI072_17925 [Polyangiaceae bacterium]